LKPKEAFVKKQDLKKLNDTDMQKKTIFKEFKIDVNHHEAFASKIKQFQDQKSQRDTPTKSPETQKKEFTVYEENINQFSF